MVLDQLLIFSCLSLSVLRLTPFVSITSDKTNPTNDTLTNTLLDREAQRAIRERTKNQIDTLERRIQELTNQQPYQELQSVLRAKEAVEQENADIKRRLAGIVAMLQPIIGQGKFTVFSRMSNRNGTNTVGQLLLIKHMYHLLRRMLPQCSTLLL